MIYEMTIMVDSIKSADVDFKMLEQKINEVIEDYISETELSSDEVSIALYSEILEE